MNMHANVANRAGRLVVAALILACGWALSPDALADTTPDPLAFVDATVNSQQSTLSNTVVIQGIDAPVTLRVSGHGSARFKINGGSLRSEPATVKAGDRVRLRLMSSATPGSRSAHFEIGGVSGTWTVSTVLASGCGPNFNPGQFGDQDGDGKPESLHEFAVDGVARAAAVRFPRGYDNRVAHPLVFEFHGDQHRGNDGLGGAFAGGLIGADEYNNRAIVVALRGENLLAPEVDDGYSEYVSWNNLSPPSTNNDIKAVLALRDKLVDAACVDPQRMFAVGFSGGGSFTGTLRCYGVPLRAIATFASGIEGKPAGYEYLADHDGNPLALDLGGCAATQAPALVVHGGQDTSVAAAQDKFAARHWAKQNGCNASLADATPSALDSACVEFAGCGSNEVVYCRPEAVGHEVWRPDVITSFFGRYFQ